MVRSVFVTLIIASSTVAVADPPESYDDSYDYDADSDAGSYDDYNYDEPHDVDSVRDFYDELAPYGTWGDVQGYGYGFTPSAAHFQPYSDGYWQYTSRGFMWVSNEPFGWACYHYGRWVWVDRWVWLPATVWGPSWVDWRETDDYVAWAPMGPSGWVAPDWGWRGVRWQNVLAVNLNVYYVVRINVIVQRARPIARWQPWRGRRLVLGPSPARFRARGIRLTARPVRDWQRGRVVVRDHRRDRDRDPRWQRDRMEVRRDQVQQQERERLQRQQERTQREQVRDQRQQMQQQREQERMQRQQQQQQMQQERAQRQQMQQERMQRQQQQQQMQQERIQRQQQQQQMQQERAQRQQMQQQREQERAQRQQMQQQREQERAQRQQMQQERAQRQASRQQRDEERQRRAPH